MNIFLMSIAILLFCGGTTLGCKSSSNEEWEEDYLDYTDGLGFYETKRTKRDIQGTTLIGRSMSIS